MKVIVAEKCGFCPGVKNAIRIAEQLLRVQKDVYSFGPVIHNEDVVRRLADSGLSTVENIDQISDGTVLIRSHGAAPQQFAQLMAKGLNIVDATCVLVKKVQKIAQQLNKDGYRVVIVGDERHPEVRAVVGCCSDVVVLAGKEDIQKMDQNQKLGVICQTTESPDYYRDMLKEIEKKDFKGLKVVDTLCKEAIQRQRSAVKLCKKVDIMFVLGGSSSANTRRLAQLCKKYNNKTFYLQNWSECDKNVLFGSSTAGVTAGASTPEWIIEEFVRNLMAFDSGISKDK